tara:strand:- start:9372 stop:9749 length:378 start_codon:yes stop_codon:yes gene_type:complete
MKNSFENEYAEYGIINGVVRFIYKQNVAIQLAGAMKIVSDRLHLQKGMAYPILCDIRGIIEIDKDARSFLANEGSTLTTAVAFISDNPLSKILTDLYLQANTPPIPTKVVNNESEGLQFLSEFIE